VSASGCTRNVFREDYRKYRRTWRDPYLAVARKYIEDGTWIEAWVARLPEQQALFSEVKAFLDLGSKEQDAERHEQETRRANELDDAQRLVAAEHRAKEDAEARTDAEQKLRAAADATAETEKQAEQAAEARVLAERCARRWLSATVIFPPSHPQRHRNVRSVPWHRFNRFCFLLRLPILLGGIWCVRDVRPAQRARRTRNGDPSTLSDY
jgi:hypothetical protein